MSTSSSLQEIVNIHKDGSIDNLAKETSIRSIIQRESAGGDLISFLLSHADPEDDNFVVVLESIDQYSHLFADIIRSPHFLAFISLLKGKWSDRILSAGISMIKISWKLNSTSNEVPVAHIRASTDLGFFLIASPNLSLAEQASRLALSLLKYSDFQESLGILHFYIKKHDQNSEIIFRYLSLITEVASDDEETARLSIDSGILEILFAISNGKDILLVINSMDLLAKWSRTRIGLDALCDKGIVAWLINISSDRSDFLLNSEALRALASIFADAADHSRGFLTKINSQVVSAFLSSIIRCFHEGDETEKVSGILYSLSCLH